MRREGEDLHSRFVALWEPVRGRDVVAGIVDLAPDDPNTVALEIRTAPTEGEQTIRAFYASDPATPPPAG